jgi:ribosomal protein S18 acetylase RimI-like enzyme
MRLRMATEYDVEFMLYVQEKINRSYVEKHMGKWDLNFQKIFLEKSMEREKYNIICMEDEKVGIFSWNEDMENVYLHELLILPKFQKNKIGSMLLDMLIKRAEYFKKDLTAYVFKSNMKAMEFYKKRDFEIKEETRSHFKIIHQKRGKQG